MDQSRTLFVYFRSFLTTISIIQIEKSIDGMLGIRTRGHRIIYVDETTELVYDRKKLLQLLGSNQNTFKEHLR